MLIFTFRGDKYSQMKYHWYHFSGVDYNAAKSNVNRWLSSVKEIFEIFVRLVAVGHFQKGEASD